MRLIDADYALKDARINYGGVYDAVLMKHFLDRQPTIADVDEIQPNDPITLDELREMDGEPVYGADGECYIVNVQNEYATDKYRGFRMLWEEGFFYRRKPKEGTTNG